MSFIGLELAEMLGPPGVEEGEETGGEEDEEESRPPIGVMSCCPIICSTVTGLMTRCEHCMTSPRSLCSLACSSRLHLLKKASLFAQWLQVTSMRSDRLS